MSEYGFTGECPKRPRGFYNPNMSKDELDQVLDHHLLMIRIRKKKGSKNE